MIIDVICGVAKSLKEKHVLDFQNSKNLLVVFGMNFVPINNTVSIGFKFQKITITTRATRYMKYRSSLPMNDTGSCEPLVYDFENELCTGKN